MNIRIARCFPNIYKLLSDMLVKGSINHPVVLYQLSGKMDRADQAIMASNDFKTEMFASLHEGFRQGGKASSLEIVQLMHGWGFKPENIIIPVDLWRGDSDHHVPQVFSRRFEEHIKKDQRHYMFYTHWPDILH
ncbi:MAG: hypothetical protein OEY11_04400 [Gammaproteobacteria bacterium]|nr:hypothetical protein [Gammaproteobacteria bacterium]